MSEKRFKLSRKNFAATRVLAKGKDADPHWSYMYVNSKGTICTDREALIRVSLPDQTDVPASPQVFTKDMLDGMKPSGDNLVTMPEGREAKCDGELSVPKFDLAIPDPATQTASITVKAKHLIKILKAACEVTGHSMKFVKLRICGDGHNNQQLRIDAPKDEDGQEFTGVLMGTVYTGNNIPGEPANGNAPKSETFDERRLTLPLTEGRKFRNEEKTK